MRSYMSFAMAAALFSLHPSTEKHYGTDAMPAMPRSRGPKGHSWAGRRRKLKARNRDHQARR